MNLLDLPDCMIEQIFEYLSYDEIARKRLICRRIDKICQHLLNIGFSKMIRRHNKDLKRIKSLLPRRESERRNHPLARHADILTCIETRISMLSMTYSKYMELNLCCFIPGKVIDEVFRILHLIETTTKPLRAHEVLQELRDISSMAIEHFDEKIAHLLKKFFIDINSQQQKYTTGICDQIASTSLDDGIIGQISIVTGSSSSGSHLSQNRNDSSTTIIPLKCSEARTNRLIIQKLEHKYNAAIKKFNRLIQIQNKQSRQLRENAVVMSEMNAQITELKRRVEESDAKNREIMANITQITTTGESSNSSGVGGGSGTGGGTGGVVNNSVLVIGGTGSSSVASSININCPVSERTSNIAPTRNIKPRAATILLKRRIASRSTSSFYVGSGDGGGKTVISNEIIDNDVQEIPSKMSKLDS